MGLLGTWLTQQQDQWSQLFTEHPGNLLNLDTSLKKLQYEWRMIFTKHPDLEILLSGGLVLTNISS